MAERTTPQGYGDLGPRGTLKPGGVIEHASDGLATANETWQFQSPLKKSKIRYAEFFVIGRTAHPDHPNLILESFRYGGQSATNELSEVACVYRGVIEPAPPLRWKLQASTDTEPIVAHPRFATQIGGRPGRPLNAAVFDPETGAFLSFPATAPNDLPGVQSYLCPGAVVTYTLYTKVFPDLAVNSRGKIVPMPKEIGLVVSQGNWINLAAEVEKFGSYYKLDGSLKLSGPRGWNKLIYGT